LLANELVIDKHWEDGTVNAYASENGNNDVISMFGGLARHPAITPDAFYLVACHEIGHHLGGAPKKGNTQWASNEGQADSVNTLMLQNGAVSAQEVLQLLIQGGPGGRKRCTAHRFAAVG